MERSNRLLYESTSPEKFVTVFYGILDTSTHQLCYSNAGQDNPYLLSGAGEPRRLAVGGVPLSMLESFPYQEETVSVHPGDILVICSDGIAEAMNSDQEQFGEERLTPLLRGLHSASAADVVEKVIGAVRAHAGTAPQGDDITIVVVKRTIN
jgi:sigma-B regulation protein RsbU (phosphoserine phosphatase)